MCESQREHSPKKIYAYSVSILDLGVQYHVAEMDVAEHARSCTRLARISDANYPGNGLEAVGNYSHAVKEG
jgi:hypothetical protein